MAEQKKVWYAPYKFEAFGQEEIDAVVSCLKDGWLAPGPRTEEFENKMCEKFGKKCGVFVNSGSSANLLALATLGVGPGDEVITPALSFSTVVAPIIQLGATPIFVDNDPRRYVPTVEALVAKLTPKTKCFFVPNLVGSQIDWEGLRKAKGDHPALLVEDSCDTIVCSPHSDVAISSFYASHIITTGGGGGITMFNDPALKKRALMFRDWGRIGNNSEDVSERFAHNVDGIEYDFKFLYGVLGYNLKSTEMNAAFGLAQLEKLPKFMKIRRANIERYLENLKDCPFITLPNDEGKHNWMAFPMLTPYRKQLLPYLEEHNVQTRVCFAGNITRHPAYRQYLGDFPEADVVMREGFLLGAHHGLTTDDVDYVCDLIKKFVPPTN